MANHIVSTWHPGTSCSLLNACAFPMSSQSSFEISEVLWPYNALHIGALTVACIVASAKLRPFNCPQEKARQQLWMPSIWILAFGCFWISWCTRTYAMYICTYMYVAIYCTHTDIYIYTANERKNLTLTWCASFWAAWRALQNRYQCHSIELSTSFLLDLDFQNIFKKCSPRIDLACCEQRWTKHNKATMHNNAFFLPSLHYAAWRTRCRKLVIVSNTHHFDEVESNLCHSGSDNKTQRH